MGVTQMASRIQIRRDTAVNWTEANPVLAQGEFGVETDTLKLKIGDGVTFWNDLRYYHSGSPYDAGEGISIEDMVISNTGIITLETGTQNGTIKANGTDVSVKGLGSAAYTSSSSYDASGAANTAETNAKNYADSLASNYATAAQGAKADNAADKNLSNLTSIGKNIGNWSNNITNCITEAPQDIKLELNDGTLTLKAGSKVYIPNGSGVFDTVTTNSNISFGSSTSPIGGNNTQVFIAYRNGVLTSRPISSCESGAGVTAVGGFAYDTTTNKIGFYNSGGTLQSSDWSFPIAIVSTNNNGIASSIDQIFNGFGYIGSSIFALPGVKGLIPNGRNTDGTLKNVAWTSSQVIVRTFANAAKNALFFDGSAFAILTFKLYEYKEPENINWDNYGQQKYITTYIGLLSTTTGGVITHFNPKTDFHAVDYNDGDYIAHCAMPSGKHINLTLPTSGNPITAPADGYLAISKATDAVGQFLVLYNIAKAMRVSSYTPVSGYIVNCVLPVSKDDVVTVSYSAGGNTAFCVFVYANGAK